MERTDRDIVLTMSKERDKTDCCVVVIRHNFMHFG